MQNPYTLHCRRLPPAAEGAFDFLPPSVREGDRVSGGRSLAESKTPPVTYRWRMFSHRENILPDEG